MSPIVQEEDTHIVVVIGSSGSVDDDSTKDTLPCLKCEVGMVP